MNTSALNPYAMPLQRLLISPLKALTGLTLVYLERLMLEQLDSAQRQHAQVIELARQGLSVTTGDEPQALLHAQEQAVRRWQDEVLTAAKVQARLHALYLEHVQILNRHTSEGLSQALHHEPARQAA
ncbi:hypothetical protein [Alkalilimnicola ehrlichii]|uniref:hypothetical protein n=1 Tax=Alkalilimnicola ehrlichii TaxID=351052 RepID=UPI003BA20A6F